MALSANALTTVERFAGFMGISVPASGSTDEIRLEAYINSISNFITRYTGKTFKKTTYTQEEYSAERGQSINLRHYPVVASEPFIIERRNNQLNENGWEVIDGEFYTVDMDAGIVFNMGGINFFRGRNGYRITYTAGYDFNNSTTFLGDTEVGDLELALWLMGQDFYNNSTGSGGNIKSERIGDYSVTYAGVQGAMLQNAQALSILSGYEDIRGDGVLTPTQ